MGSHFVNFDVSGGVQTLPATLAAAAKAAEQAGASWFTTADLDGFLRTAEQYAALGIDLIDIMSPEDTTDPVAFASRLGELVIPRVAQIECGPKPRGSADRPARVMTVTSKDVAPAHSRVSRHTSKCEVEK